MLASTADVAHMRSYRSRFYMWVAGVFVLIACGEFIQSYWARLATGSFTGAPVRTRGRPHQVYLIGGGAGLAVQILCVPLSATAAWIAIASHVEALAG
jgi:hypothetical protein